VRIRRFYVVLVLRWWAVMAWWWCWRCWRGDGYWGWDEVVVVGDGGDEMVLGVGSGFLQPWF
jgi:hypothetical protein